MRFSISLALSLTGLLALSSVQAAPTQAAPTQVAGAKCSTVSLDDDGTLTVQAKGKTVNLSTPLNFKCGTLSVTDDGKTLKVAGKTLTEALSIFPQSSTFAQVWGLYVIDFSKPGVLSIVDSSDKTVPTKAMLADMKDSIGDASATFSQPGLSGWVFKNAQLQSARYDVKKPVTVTFKDSGAAQPFSSIVVDAKKGTIQAKHNAL